MTHTYSINGMTCNGCQEKVKELLLQVNGVKSVSINLAKGEAEIDMTNHVSLAELKSNLKNYPNYQVEEKDFENTDARENETWFDTYKPIVIVGIYIIAITLLIELANGGFVWKNWMQNFMAAFFLVFSFFKFLDIRGFAEGYASYDIIAKRWKAWGYIYAIIELYLGLCYMLKFNPLLTNAITFVVMSISIIGVLQSVLNKRKIKCACLGAVFNLPMSTITIIEDTLMIGMSAITIIAYL